MWVASLLTFPGMSHFDFLIIVLDKIFAGFKEIAVGFSKLMNFSVPRMSAA